MHLAVGKKQWCFGNLLEAVIHLNALQFEAQRALNRLDILHFL